MEELIINISDITLETTLFHLTFASYLAWPLHIEAKLENSNIVEV
jgi:hypothetical protein